MHGCNPVITAKAPARESEVKEPGREEEATDCLLSPDKLYREGVHDLREWNVK
jgi:hypothetical protein